MRERDSGVEGRREGDGESEDKSTGGEGKGREEERTRKGEKDRERKGGIASALIERRITTLMAQSNSCSLCC